jgi:acyl-CoA synthetase (AMP-forming)/AMP-acid ligase II
MLIGETSRTIASALREVASAGEPLNPEVIDRVHRAWGLTIRDGYGQTETTAQVGTHPASQCGPGRWDARSRAIVSCSSTPTASQATRVRSPCRSPRRRRATAARPHGRLPRRRVTQRRRHVGRLLPNRRRRSA